ncbi:hypothetical protein MRB53_022735 [Persea americana]|uniref:Uncharacterized protein n=1 Tax=Persea americana TaxID=3435 RepID=A0ACC2L7F9_PERAE|nr:hypothetical protein MRB53_022735 [Persea americana]
MHRQLPWLMMLPNNKEEEGEDPDTRVFFNLSQQKIHTIPLPEMHGKRCCGSFHNGWLMFVDLKLDICLFHPWSRKKIHLPPQSTFKKPNFVNDDNEVDEVDDYTYTMEEIRDNEILKAAQSDDGNMVVVLYGLGHLGFCRIGEDDSYTDVESDSLMEDVRYHKGHFYALSQRGSLYLLYIEDSFHPHAEKLTIDLDTDDDPLPYVFVALLVPDIVTDTMFVISRDGYGHKTIHFDIFRVSLEEGADEKKLKKFTKIESLGDRGTVFGA